MSAVGMVLPVLGLALIPACRFDPGGLAGPGQDGSVSLPDAARSDGSTPDAARPDASLLDGALPDGALPDGSLPDGALPDATLPDGATPTDTDGDGVPDVTDNCPMIPNTDQANGDGDSHGDACDNCPGVDNENQTNSDTDTLGDACDNCPGIDNQNQDNHDGDIYGDLCDNCPNDTNPGQSDIDGDSQGDVCDPDRDGDTVPNRHDPDPDVAQTVDYYDDFDTDPGDFYYVNTGNWSDSTSSICSVNDNARHQRARLMDTAMTMTDMVVETVMTVTSVNLSTSEWPAAGISFRFEDHAIDNFDAYHCTVDLENGRLAFIESYNADNYTVHTASANGSVPLTGSYHLRAQAVGSSLSCTILPSGLTITVTDTTRTGGTAGFFTYLAAACFDYLLVYAPPPP